MGTDIKVDSFQHMQPKVSIITVTYNAEKYLEKTIQSIIRQSYTPLEYIIIDGQSKDRTLEIAERYRDHIDLLITEPDKGLYDAMNKGLNQATGEYILFINAGDYLDHPDTIQNTFKSWTVETDILYGKTMLIDESGNKLGLRSELTTRKLPKKLSWKSLRWGMVVCHQSIIVRRSIAPQYLINNLSADIDWVIKSLKVSKKTTYVDLVISRFMTGGLSKQQQKQSLVGRFNILKKHYGLIVTLFSHLLIFLRALFFLFFRIGKPKYN